MPTRASCVLVIICAGDAFLGFDLRYDPVGYWAEPRLHDRQLCPLSANYVAKTGHDWRSCLR